MKTMKKLLSVLMIVLMVFTLVPDVTFAGSTATVYVTVVNNTYTESDAAWSGKLLDTSVTISAGESAMDAIVKALEANDISQTGAENNYIEEIGGLSAFDGGFMSGWMITIDDWFTNYGADAFVFDPSKEGGDEYLAPGSVIALMYTCDYGEDLGGSWNNNIKTLKDVKFSAGTLDKEFSSDEHKYTLTVPAGTDSVKVTPTATNKNFLVKTSLDGNYYGRRDAIAVKNGDVITVECGNPSWPTMNASDEPGEVYTFTVSCEEEPVETVNLKVSLQNSNVYMLVPTEMSVQGNLAEKYGYKDTVEGVSALDVLVKLHEYFFEDEFTAETAEMFLDVSDAGYVSTAFADMAYNMGFAINGGFPYDPTSEYGSYGYTGYSLNQAAVVDGDMVEFFYYVDDYYMDYYTWLEQDGKKVTEITGTEGSDITVNVNGYVFMFGSYKEEDLLDMDMMGPLSDVQLVLADQETGEFTIIDDAVSDEEGNVTFSLENAGSYILSAVGAEDGYTTVISPWVKLNIKEDKSGANTLIVRTSTSTSNLSNAILAGENTSGVAVFDKKTLTYDLGDILLDTNTQLRFWYTLPEANMQVKAVWGNAASESKELTKSTATALTVNNVFANCLKPGKNEIKLTFTPAKAGTELKPVTYTISVNCVPTLTALSATADGAQVYLDKTFAAATKEYTLTVSEDAEKVVFEAAPKSADYTVTYNGSTSKEVVLDGTSKVDIEVSTADGTKSLYEISLNKVKSGAVKINAVPENAVVAVYDNTGKKVEPNEDGSYSGLFSTYDYTYTVSLYGYKQGTGIIPADANAIDVELVKADTVLPSASADWWNFRNSAYNMGITNVKTPVVQEDTTLLWNAKLGSGWAAAPSIQIIVDDSLVVISDKTIYKLDLATGETLATGTLASGAGYGYTPMTYAEGMIFVPLQSGTIQAFNAKTLESVWVYKDSLGGQSLSPIAYSDGYIYTGWWNSEVKDANFACISVTDEDPEKTDEAKGAVWKYPVTGGFYWAGSVVVGDYVIVGTDDGTSGTAGDSRVISFNKYTGEIVSSLTLSGAGDQRSSMAYDAASGKVYFTTKGGRLGSASVSADGILSGLKLVNYNAQSTSTPVVYKGKVYFATGSGISSSGSSGNFVVADADTLEMLYFKGLKGYPQCSMLLSTAYEAEDGYIYLYSTYNANPGGISMIKTTPDNTTADGAEVIELYDAKGFEQYCITSIICGTDGTLYYKNDSGNVLAVGVPESTTVENLIKKIGEVTLESEQAIEDARKAYEALSDESKAKVSNYETLLQAEETLLEVKAGVVEDLIDEIGEVTLEKEDEIAAARDAYDSLPEEIQERVDNYETLLEAESMLDELKIENVEDKIDAIGNVTLKSEDKIKAAREAYDALPDGLKEDVTNADKLKAAEKKLADLKKAQGNTTGGGTVPAPTVKEDEPGTTVETPTTPDTPSVNPPTVIEPDKPNAGDLPAEEVKGNSVPWGWIGGGAGAGILALIFFILAKRKKDDK
ncbi:MAG: cadherin-like beta sandwich domain-containing protein [Clostridia bacterium]|nr:cadherin-like beta sandwich domain-containing protein [Clostridia bacterium]